MLLARADRARDEHRHAAAAELYEEVLGLADRADIHVQRANMLKESGRFAEAERHYRIAAERGADDADLALQFGHLHKVTGRLVEAREQYRRASTLRPGWSVPIEELAALDLALRSLGSDAAADRWPDLPSPIGADPATAPLRDGGDLVPGLAPRRLDEMLRRHDETIEVRRAGRREEGPWGIQRTVRGIEAVHGLVRSETPVVAVSIIVNGIELARQPLKGGYALPLELEPDRIRKYVFNVWVDFSGFADGLHALELRFVDAAGGSRSWHDRIVIAAPVAEGLYPDSDFLIAPDPDDPRPIDVQVRSRPSQVREAARSPFPDGVRRVLVLRTDQLGDLVASLPALRRLRALLPQALIVGAVTDANADFARTLVELLDEIIVVDFPDIPIEQRRVMPLAEQRALRDRLHAYRFDVAIDLSRAGVSRELLRLSGATFTYGIGGGDWPFLSADFVFNTHDRWTGHDMTPHSRKVLAMIEALGTILAASPPVVRGDDLTRDRLSSLGLLADDRYVVLHPGARIGFSRWPHHAVLIRLLLERTDLKIVVIGDDAMPPGFADDLNRQRLVLLDRQLPFDTLDALLSFATVMVGNDSGPKHLAALRGTPVVTIFSARINWTEWGQEGSGVVISRKVPCAGCAILHEPEDCGRDFACITDIRPEEVCEQILRLVRSGSVSPEDHRPAYRSPEDGGAPDAGA